MRLLIIFPSLIRGGAEEYALTIATAATQKDWEVHAAFPTNDKTATLVKDFQQRGIFYHPLAIPPVEGRKLKLFREHLPQLFKTILLLRKLQPDVVHLTVPWPDWCFANILACGFLKVPTAVVFQLFPRLFSYSQFRLKGYAWARSRRQEWVAISENNRSFISESFQIPQEQIKLIYNGTTVSSDLINCTPQEVQQIRSLVRQEIGVPETSKLLLTVARLEKKKGYMELMEVAAAIAERFPEVRFIWVGEGSLRNYLEIKIKDYALEDKVFLLGFRSDVVRLLKAADLFVFPTHLEGLPFAVIEALAYRLPVVASDASSLPEIIENKVNGLLFPTQDQEAFLETIVWALNHPEIMQEMAEKAQDRVRDFSQEKMIDQTIGLLQRMAEIK